MRLFVSAKPDAKQPSIKKADATHWWIAVKESAKDGKANAAIVKAIAENLGLSPSRIKIAKGRTSRQKIVEIL